MSQNQPKYKRILLKLSGEALAGDKKMGLDMPTVTEICKSIKKCYDVGTEIGIVVGGGNYWRGRSSESMDRVRADHIGMLATAMNALAVADVLESLGCQVRVQTAIDMKQVAEPYIRQKAVRHFEKGRIVIFGCGTGSPFFSTDSAAALRAAEINADILLKATMVDGIYDKDPHMYSDAIKYDYLTHQQILVQSLKVMDSAAAAMCRENKTPILVFDLSLGECGLILRAPVYRLLALIDIAALCHLAEDFNLLGFKIMGQRQIGTVPIAQNAQTAELFALRIDMAAGKLLALVTKFDDRSLLAIQAECLDRLTLNRQTVRIPAGNVRRLEAGHILVTDNEVLQNLVERMTHVKIAVRIRRAIVQDKQGFALILLHHLLIKLISSLIPGCKKIGLALGQTRSHRKVGLGKIDCCVIILRHNTVSILSFLTYHSPACNRSQILIRQN